MQIATLIVHVNRYINSTCKSFHWLTVHVNHYTSNTCKLLCRILSSHILTKKVCRNSKTFQKTDMNILCEGNVDLSQYFTDWLTVLIFHPSSTCCTWWLAMWTGHSPLITPMIRGWGMADLMWRDCSYRVWKLQQWTTLINFIHCYTWIFSNIIIA